MTDITLEQRIAALEVETGKSETIPAKDVADFVSAVKSMFGRGDKLDGNLFHEIGELAKFINNAKKELQEVQGTNLAEKEIPQASNQLDAIVQMTEQATGRIMDECEGLNTNLETMRDVLLSMDPPLDPDALAGIDGAMTEAAAGVTRVFEACNFQDITGQRIQKVVKALHEIERQVLRMVVVFGLAAKEDTLDDTTKAELAEDRHLLEGPSLPGQGGLEQDDIDDILAKLL
ncbi:MAG: hypothetical protein COY40_02975 [Alphaproteobacteria bacterium CG_4_10_14_0_8_um_filter_53_9]|nr:MAG: hypothetical protein COY40_02975 [Alphaproteobacteria bacterium CG_4_10_14_0_8_um_filter_53_9]